MARAVAHTPCEEGDAAAVPQGDRRRGTQAQRARSQNASGVLARQGESHAEIGLRPLIVPSGHGRLELKQKFMCDKHDVSMFSTCLKMIGVQERSGSEKGQALEAECSTAQTYEEGPRLFD